MSRDEERGDYPGAHVPRAWETAHRLRAHAAANDDAPAADGLPVYAELHCLSDFSFLRGASSAEDLFVRAKHCGYEALAITDECSLAGIVRGLEASRATGVPLIVGSEFVLECGLKLVLLVENQSGYVRLCELITTGRRAAGKGSYRLARQDVERVLGDASGEGLGLFALWVPGAQPDAGQAVWMQQVFVQRTWLAVHLHPGDPDIPHEA